MFEFFIFLALCIIIACMFGIGRELAELNMSQKRTADALELLAKIANIKRGG
jgi:hypothetical protein